jgi:ABC-type glycerol-3-phosphate transport system permease component
LRVGGEWEPSPSAGQEHDQNYQTAAQAVALFVISDQGGAHVTWQLAMAVALAAPIVAAYIVAQKHIVEGIATTGIK